MTPNEIAAAIAYNKRHGYSSSQVKLCQQVVGARPDGAWGPKTIQAVSAWQAAHGLKPDGKVGSLTFQAMVEELECQPPPSMPHRRPVEIGCGLAAYDQAFPGHTEAEAMGAALGAARAEGCTEIRYWSSEHLIKDLGNKGNSYSEPFLRALRLDPSVRLGAWIDDPVSVVTTAAYVDRLVRMHIRSAALMMNKSNTHLSDAPWALRWSDEDDLKTAASLLHARDIEVACTAWPRPSKNQIDVMCEDMARLLHICGAAAFEVDTEANWVPDFLDGFANMRLASEYLAKKMREAAGPDRRLELTTYTYHTENSKRAKLAPLMDRLLPQAYSVRNRSEGPVGWSDSLGPGRHQRLAISRARQAAAA